MRDVKRYVKSCSLGWVVDPLELVVNEVAVGSSHEVTMTAEVFYHPVVAHGWVVESIMLEGFSLGLEREIQTTCRLAGRGQEREHQILLSATPVVGMRYKVRKREVSYLGGSCYEYFRAVRFRYLFYLLLTPNACMATVPPSPG